MADREPALLGGDPATAAPTGEAESDRTEKSAAPEREPEPEPEPAPEPAPEAEPARTPGPAREPTRTRTPTPAPAPVRSRTAPRPVARSARQQAPTFHVGGFWRRLAAAFVDLLVILPVALLLCWIAGAIAGIHLPAGRLRGIDFWIDLLLASDPALIGGLGLTMAIALVYVFLFQVTMGRTLGMRLLKMRIIDVYGDPPSTGRAALRSAGYVAGAATLLLGFLWIGFDSEKRGLHDWIAGTYVVKA